MASRMILNRPPIVFMKLGCKKTDFTNEQSTIIIAKNVQTHMWRPNTCKLSTKYTLIFDIGKLLGFKKNKIKSQYTPFVILYVFIDPEVFVR